MRWSDQLDKLVETLIVVTTAWSVLPETSVADDVHHLYWRNVKGAGCWMDRLWDGNWNGLEIAWSLGLVEGFCGMRDGDGDGWGV